MDNELNDQAGSGDTAAGNAGEGDSGKTRRLVLKMAGVGGALGAAGIAGAAGVAAASGDRSASQAGSAGFPTTGVASILAVPDAGAALKFFQDAFDAEVLIAAKNPAGDVVHAEFLIEGTVVGVTNEDPDRGIVAATAGATPNCEAAYVREIGSAVQRVADAGAEVLLNPIEISDFLRHACFRDPFGHNWHLFEVVRPFSAAELQATIEADLAEV